MAKTKQFWNMKQTATNSAELQLYGPISEFTWWGDEITPKQFADDVNALGADIDEITVRINSGGGDVFAGITIYNILKGHKANITVRIEGLAASIASIIAMSGDRIVMATGSMMMIHNPWMMNMSGASKDFREAADMLDKVRESLIDVYAERTKASRKTIELMLDDETWMTASEAVETGFADEADGNSSVEASYVGNSAVINGIQVDLSKYRHGASFAAGIANAKKNRLTSSPGDLQLTAAANTAANTIISKINEIRHGHSSSSGLKSLSPQTGGGITENELANLLAAKMMEMRQASRMGLR